MDWLSEHLGSLGYAGDFYIPQSGGGSSNNNKGGHRGDKAGNNKGGERPDQSNSADDAQKASNSNGTDKSNEQSKRSVGAEQIKAKKIDCTPRVVKGVIDGYPRTEKFFEWEQFLDYVDWHSPQHSKVEKFLKSITDIDVSLLSTRRSQKQTREGYDVTGVWSFQQAMDLARYGWQDGLEKVKELRKINFPIKDSLSQNYEIETRYNVAGGAVNIGRYLSGMPDCMRHMHIQSGHSLPSRVQKILIIGDFHKGISTEQVIKHGYNVYQIVQALEMTNIQTEITMAFQTCKEDAWKKTEDGDFKPDFEFYETYIKIKDSMDTIYPEKLLFCVAHPSMFRRLVFSEWERNPASVRAKFHFYGYCENDGEGYGHAISTWKPPREYAKDALIIPGANDDDDTLDEVLYKVKRMIKSQYEQSR